MTWRKAWITLLAACALSAASPLRLGTPQGCARDRSWHRLGARPAGQVSVGGAAVQQVRRRHGEHDRRGGHAFEAGAPDVPRNRVGEVVVPRWSVADVRDDEGPPQEGARHGYPYRALVPVRRRGA